MPRLRKSSVAISYKQKYSFRKWRQPSSHPKTTKKSSFKKEAGKKIVLHFPRDVALSKSEVKQYLTKKTLSKANEIHQHQIIVHIFQEIMHFPLRCKKRVQALGWQMECTDGIERQLIANALQSGGNFLVQQRQIDGNEKMPTQLMSSGSSNPYSPWARASYCWANQLAIYYGKN
eukprot:13317153-Ditylum_brightwellii.AAC.1